MDVEASIAKHGWHAISVDDHDPPFLYTIGARSIPSSSFSGSRATPRTASSRAATPHSAASATSLLAGQTRPLAVRARRCSRASSSP